MELLAGMKGLQELKADISRLFGNQIDPILLPHRKASNENKYRYH
jgi:hypothetical protein